MPGNVVQRTFAAGGAVAPVPTPRTDPLGCGWRSVARRRPISRVYCHSHRHRPVRVRIPNGSFLRRCIGLRRHSASPTCENRAPTPRRGLGGMKHERDAFRRVVQRALTRSTNPEDVALTPQLPNCTPVRDAPSPQLDPPRGEPKTDILWIPVRARVARRVRALVTRSTGGPSRALRRERDRRTKDTYDRLLPIPSNQSGTLIRVVTSPFTDRCGRRFTTPLRACRGLGSRSERAFLPAESRDSSHV